MARQDSSEYRLSTLQLLLQWEGLLSRSRIAKLLNLGDVRASQWIQEFRDAHPTWLKWDSKSKCHYATDDAYMAMSNINNAVPFANYLNLVNAPHVIANSDEYLCAAFPELSTPNPEIFSEINQAIRSKLDLKVIYRSMSSPKQHERSITPHHLVRVGSRWHVRAYCASNNDYRDYNLGRFVQVKQQSPRRGKAAVDDLGWNTTVKVRLIAHPELTIEQEEVIRLEYFEGTTARIVSCRAALLPYFVQDIRAATDMSMHKPPEYQLAISNLDEISSWLFS